MQISPELSFIFIMLLSLLTALAAARLGRNWLYITMIALSLTSTLTAGKIISIFGFSASIATPIFAGLFLVTDILSECEGRRFARRAVLMAFGANIFFLIAGKLVVMTPAFFPDDQIHESLSSIFDFIPRLLAGGLIAYFVAQNLDISIFHWVKEWLEKKDGVKHWHLCVYNNASTIVSQLVDSLLVYYIAFYGIIPNVWKVVLVAWVMKIFVAICDTPLLYLARKFYPRGSDE